MKKNRINQGVLGLALNQQGEFLITLRHEPQNQTHNHWQVPGGGIEFGETPEETLVRELQEEISVTPKILFPYPIARTWLWTQRGQRSHVLLLCYIVDIGQQPIVADHQETSDYRWIKPNQLSQYKYLPLTNDFVNTADDIVSKHHLLKLLA